METHRTEDLPLTCTPDLEALLQRACDLLKQCANESAALPEPEKLEACLRDLREAR